MPTYTIAISVELMSTPKPIDKSDSTLIFSKCATPDFMWTCFKLNLSFRSTFNLKSPETSVLQSFLKNKEFYKQRQ